MHLQENDIFDGRYRMLKRIGQGGFSEIWLAEDTKTDVEIALKIYAPGSGLDEDGIKLFKEEFKRVFDLANPYLLRPMTFDIYDRTPYLVMSYCSHGSVSKYRKKLLEKDMWLFMRDVSSGLAYLHSLEPPIVHQDIKPENILISGKGDFLITDFGISTEIRSTLSRSTLVSSGGTIAYMAPERFSSKPSPVKASDVWSLGATMFELMTGDVPFGEHGGLIQYGGAALPELEGEYSKELKKYVLACLQKNPWDRPSAAELYKVAQDWLNGEKIKTPHKKKEVSVLWKRPVVWIATAVIALLLGLGVYTTLSGGLISVVQEWFATLSVSQTNFSVAETAGSNTFTITSNTNWTASSDQIWCTVSSASGTNNATVTFDVEENTTTTRRTATIKITAGAQTRTVSVVQEWQTNIIFADAKFKDYCVGNFDRNHDGEISKAEAAKVKKIDVSGTDSINNKITSLQGIEFFTALDTLFCYNNQLTQLDVSKNTALTYLACKYNQLTQLDVSKNTALTSLVCLHNELTQLDVSMNTSLTGLNCRGNQLTQLDLSNNTALTSLSCWSNQLTQLDLSKNIALTYLACGNNQLTQLDVSNNTALTSLYCSNNQLAQLYVNNNTALARLYCSDNPNLTKLYLKTGQTISTLSKDDQTQIIYK